MHNHISTRRGFTLIELLVVVLIIGILAAVALPQYQKAILKSRFSALMPIAKAVADGNEVYYMEKGEYIEDPTELDVAGQDRYPDGTQITMGSDNTLAYVLAGSDNTPGAKYVVYQKHSQNFPDNIHCEALDTDEQATWLCKDALHGTAVNTGDIKSISGNEWTAYRISGTTVGSTFDKSCEGSAPTEEGDTCPSGCGKMTATASCNPRTGQWGEPEFNDDSCPSPLPDDTQTCENGTGTKVRHSQCKSDGSGYEYGAWDESGCCEGEKPTTTFQMGKLSGGSSSYYSGSITAGDWECVNGQWQFGSFTSTLQIKNLNASCSDFYRGTSSPGGGACSGTYTNGGGCTAEKKAYTCSNSTFSGFSGGYKANCNAYVANGCSNSTFNSGSSCQGSSSGAVHGCDGSTFNTGSACFATAAGACSNVIYNGGCCYRYSADCPAGSPKCVFKSGKYVTEGTW